MKHRAISCDEAAPCILGYLFGGAGVVENNLRKHAVRPAANTKIHVVAYLAGNDRCVRPLRGKNKVYAERRKVAEAIMTQLGCTFDKSQKGLFLWGRIPEGEESSEKFADRILYGARVFITPGFIFGSNGERYVRISLCATEEKMREALNRIKEMK